MNKYTETALSKMGKGLALLLALVLLNVTAFADVLTSLSFDRPPGYHQAGEMLCTGNMGEMIADNTIQFSNSDPDQHQHHTVSFHSNATVQQLAVIQHCTSALLLIERNVTPSGCPQCPLIFNNSPPMV